MVLAKYVQSLSSVLLVSQRRVSVVSRIKDIIIRGGEVCAIGWFDVRLSLTVPSEPIPCANRERPHGASVHP